MGIPRLEHLLSHEVLGPVSGIWPFEWDAKVKQTIEHRTLLVLHAEIHPSLVRVEPAPGEVKDQAQVRGLANYFRCRDEAGELSHLLDLPLTLPKDDKTRVCMEEGWISGTQPGA